MTRENTPAGGGRMFDYRAIYPYWYYFHPVLAAGGVSLPEQILTAEIKTGYDYFVEGIAAAWVAALAGGDVSPPPSIVLVQSGPRKLIHEIPVPLDIQTTPGGRTSLGQISRYITYVPIEHLFPFRDLVELRVRAAAGGDPVEAQIVIFGRNVKRRDE